MRHLLPLFALLALITFSGCPASGGDDDGPGTDNFDRTSMLTSWADQVIIPGYNSFLLESADLKAKAQGLFDSPNINELTALRTQFETTYLSWQHIAMLQIGRAENLGLREQVNAYPTDANGIETNIQSGTYNLELPSERTRQGFPALDYLLFGAAADDTALLARFTAEEGLREYVLTISERIDQMVQSVREDWINGYRDEFVNNSGNSATASVDRFVNDFVFYYEKFLRAGKVGIPAGIFSGAPLPTHVEAPYHGSLGKQLLQAALQASQDFFNGQTGDGLTRNSLVDYLDFLNTVKNGADLSQLINNQFDAARGAINNLGADLSQQVTNDNMEMLLAYDQLQMNVVLLKLDMLQALNINVDYVDADGD